MLFVMLFGIVFVHSFRENVIRDYEGFVDAMTCMPFKPGCPVSHVGLPLQNCKLHC